MAVNLTAAQARRLGLVGRGPAPAPTPVLAHRPGDPPVPPSKPARTTRRVARGAPYHTRCTRCGAEFHTEAAEERHLIEHHHARYQLVTS